MMRQREVAEFPVYHSRAHPTCWYEPEDEPEALRQLVLWALAQPGVTAVLPPGSLPLLAPVVAAVAGRSSVPAFDEERELPRLLARYESEVPIFHTRDPSGNKVSHG